MTQKQAIINWKQSAEENRQAAEDIYRSNHPEWSFFLWHLSLEKLLKGLVTKNDIVPPPTHDLVRLAKNAGIILTQHQEKLFSEITTYNIRARYDDFKRKFYQKVADKDYQEKWQKICKELFLWLEKNF